jgi:hypothetical protein
MDTFHPTDIHQEIFTSFLTVKWPSLPILNKINKNTANDSLQIETTSLQQAIYWSPNLSLYNSDFQPGCSKEVSGVAKFGITAFLLLIYYERVPEIVIFNQIGVSPIFL